VSKTGLLHNKPRGVRKQANRLLPVELNAVRRRLNLIERYYRLCFNSKGLQLKKPQQRLSTVAATD
jgi:hypothetical protein